MSRATARELGGLVDGEPVLKGQIVRVVTTGGGGWGDPLERELELVLRDVIEGRVSLASADADYGVVLAAGSSAEQPRSTRRRPDSGATSCARRARAPLPMIDRGEGYEKMLRGEHWPRMR